MIRNPGLLLALGSPLAYSLQNVWMRFQLDGSVTVWGLLLMRGLLGLAAMGLAARLLKKGLPSRNRRRLLLTGLSSYLSTICIILAIGNIPLYQALVLLYLYPALSVPLNYFLNGAPVRRATVFWVVTAFVGCLILVWPDSAAGLDIGPYHLAALGAACFYSVGLVLGADLGESGSGLESIFCYSLWAVFGTLAVVLAGGEPTGLVDGSALAESLGLGLLSTLALLMAYAALRWLPPFKVGVFGSLEVVFGALSSWLIFDDPITFRALAGGLIIMGVAVRLGAKQ